jgi:hypothetical protein
MRMRDRPVTMLVFAGAAERAKGQTRDARDQRRSGLGERVLPQAGWGAPGFVRGFEPGARTHCGCFTGRVVTPRDG